MHSVWSMMEPAMISCENPQGTLHHLATRSLDFMAERDAYRCMTNKIIG